MTINYIEIKYPTTITTWSQWNDFGVWVYNNNLKRKVEDDKKI